VSPDLIPDSSLLFGLLNTIIPKQGVRFFTEIIVKQIADKKSKNNKYNQNQQLGYRCFLNILPIFCITNLARTVLCFFFKKEGIKHITQTNPKSRFKEQEYKANQTDNTCYRAVGVYNYEKNKHGS